jgi:TorA maturation chaperone TorD
LPRVEIEREFDRMFQGVGKPEVSLYGSFYVAGKLNEKPLVALRHSLRELGIAKNESMSETEDHIASLCEVMRYLIAGDDAQTSNLTAQRRFFDTHVRPWVATMCSAIEAHADADFYAALARFAADFFAVEGQAFDLLDS